MSLLISQEAAHMNQMDDIHLSNYLIAVSGGKFGVSYALGESWPTVTLSD